MDKVSNVLKGVGKIIYNNKGFILILIAIVVFRFYFVSLDVVVGTSMEPTLHDDDIVMVDTKFYKVFELDRYDVIVFENFKSEEETYLVKRIMAFPGETVSIQQGVLYINGEEMEVPGHVNDFNYATNDFSEREVPEDHLFVLGDNRSVSLDSRDEARVGFVSYESIHGKVFFRQKPIKDFGFIK